MCDECINAMNFPVDHKKHNIAKRGYLSVSTMKKGSLLGVLFYSEVVATLLEFMGTTGKC